MRDEDVDFDVNTSSVLGANKGNSRLENGASSRRGCVSHGYNYYLLALFTLIITVVWEIFAYRNFHVLIFRVKKFSDIVYLSEKLTQNLNNYEYIVYL